MSNLLEKFMRHGLLAAGLLSLVSIAASASQSAGPGAGKVTIGAPIIGINPQPLPPIHDGAPPTVAINPQPLPPHGPPPKLDAMRGAPGSATIVLAGGGPPVVVDIGPGRRG